MRICLCLTLALGMAIGAVATAWTRQAGDVMADAATRGELARVKTAIVDGHRTRNRTVLDSLYADDYTATDAAGALHTKADLLRGLPTDPEMVEGRYTLGVVRRWGSLAVAAGHGRMVYRNDDGSTRVSEYDSVNVFEQRNGRWVYVAAFLP